MYRERPIHPLAWLGILGLLLLGCQNPFAGKAPENRLASGSDEETNRITASVALSSLPEGMQVMPFEQNLDSNLGPDQFAPLVADGTAWVYYTSAASKSGDYSLTGADASDSFSLLQRMYNLPSVQSQGYVAMPQKDFHGAFWYFVPVTGQSQQQVLHTFQKNIGTPAYYHVLLNVHTVSLSGAISVGLTVQKREDYGATQTAAASIAGNVAAADQSWHFIEYWFDKNQGVFGRAHLYVDGSEIASGDVSGSSLYDPSDIYDGDGGEDSQECDLRVMNGACIDDFMWNVLLDRSTADHEALHAAIEAYRTSGPPDGEGLPPNLVQLYASAGDIPGGATLLGAYFGLFPRITADPELLGTTGGPGDEDSAFHSAGRAPLCLDLVPVTFSQCGADAVFMFQGDDVPNGWNLYPGPNGRYLRFDSEGESDGSPECQQLPRAFSYGHSSGNGVEFRTVKLISRGDSKPILTLEELPSGTLALFNTTSIPFGWTPLDGAEEEGSFLRYIRGPSGKYGGSASQGMLEQGHGTGQGGPPYVYLFAAVKN